MALSQVDYFRPTSPLLEGFADIVFSPKPRVSQQHDWPAERGFFTYDYMSGRIIQKMVTEKQLSANEVVLDVGPGRFCSTLNTLTAKVAGIIPVAIAPHRPDQTPQDITFLYDSLPSADRTFPKAKLITDIFSSVSYASKRVGKEYIPAGHEALIKLASWLKPGGVLIACTEVTRLGESEERERISAFFKNYMGLTCTFTIYQKFAEANQCLEDQLRVTVLNKKAPEQLIRAAASLTANLHGISPNFTCPRVNINREEILSSEIKQFLSTNDRIIHFGQNFRELSALASEKRITKFETFSPSGVLSPSIFFPQIKEMNKANLITDLFELTDKAGEDALNCLIYLSQRLAQRGRLLAFTHFNCFGNPAKNWSKIRAFFRTSMGMECQFETFSLTAEESDMYLRIVIKRNQRFEDLEVLAKSHIGSATRGRLLWESRECVPADRMGIYQTVFHKTPVSTPTFE